MSIDPRSESLIPLHDVPELPWIPRRRRGRKLHASTVYRWWQRGVRGIRLEAIRVGGTLCTNESSLISYFSQLAEAEEQNLPLDKQRRVDRTQEELGQLGL